MRLNRDGFTLVEVMIVIAIIAVIAAIAIPSILASQRSSNERNTAASLKTLASAEADFRENDRDWNKVNDFWTANVAGLYTMTSAATAGAKAGEEIKLIELSMAAADTDPAFPAAAGENLALSNFVIGSTAKAGYWYMALLTDSTLTSAEATYKQDTGGTPDMGSVHNLDKFGFLAYPDAQAAGKNVFIVNESNTIFRSATSGAVKPKGVALPPGILTQTEYLSWPDANTMKLRWSKLD